MKVDIEKTKAYYNSMKAADICECSYCKNYCLQMKTVYPEIAQYLASFGIDIEKPLELSPLDLDENGMIEYCLCEYVIYGTCEETYRHKIGEVEFQVSQSHPDAGVDDAYFVIGFGPIYMKTILRFS